MKTAAAWAALGLMAASAAVAQGGSDELWSMTTRMEMEGMQMPAMAQQVCMKKGETRAEDLSQDKNCKVTEQRRDGNKFSWKVVCSGKDAMTGSGEMTRNRDSMEGRMLMKSKHGEMKIAYSGKLSGTCNAQTHQDPRMAAAQKQMAAIQAQSDAQIAQICKEGMEKFSTEAFEQQGMPCLPRKGEYCAHVKKTNESMRTPAAYRAAMQKQGMERGGWERATKFCGVQTASVAAAACGSASRGRDWDFVGEYCPAESKKIAAEHCAGRDYTAAMASEYKGVCRRYASRGGEARPAAARTQDAAPTAADVVKDSAKEGVRALKNLFGR